MQLSPGTTTRRASWLKSADESAAVLAKGYHGIRKTYEEDVLDGTKPVRTEYLDQNQNLTKIKDGYAVIENQYDERGNIIEEAYFSPWGYAAQVSQGYSVIRKEYDENNKVIRQAYFDGNGNRCSTSSGVVALAQLAYYHHYFSSKPQTAYEYGTCTTDWYQTSDLQLFNSSSNNWALMPADSSSSSSSGKQAVTAHALNISIYTSTEPIAAFTYLPKESSEANTAST